MLEPGQIMPIYPARYKTDWFTSAFPLAVTVQGKMNGQTDELDYLGWLLGVITSY
jgi:hypothetical protein